MTRTETAVTPRMASKIVPAGGLSKGDELGDCVDDCVGVRGGGVVTMMPWPASDIGTHESTIVNTVRSGAPGVVGQKRVRHAGLEVSVLLASYTLAVRWQRGKQRQTDQHLVAGPGVPDRQTESSYGRQTVLKALDEHVWPTQQARKVLENPHAAGEAQFTAVPVS